MELRELTTRVAQVAIQAGSHALQDQVNPHDLRALHPQQERQYTSEVDDRLLRYCRERIAQIEPFDGFWEDEGSDREIGKRYWCVGHIDGVINYVRNMAEWSITVSLFEIGEDGEAEPVLGIVHAPALGATYLAAKGQGAIRIRRTPNGEKREKVMPSTTTSLNGSVVSFGMSYFPKESKRALRTAGSLAGKPADIKRIGPTSLDLCKVADGTYDAYFEPTLHSWDIPAVSAAMVVVCEAQGQIEQWNGDGLHWDRNNDVVASNGLIIEDLRQYLL
ncbi:MAG: inositol monophosphatase family protein [Bifidobacterium crudilactis]|jgi:myo-inositol-1(or 4)-monophosphatase|nr:inositol monophosphatase family protein [Bifidobacterium crudilactis]